MPAIKYVTHPEEKKKSKPVKKTILLTIAVFIAAILKGQPFPSKEQQEIQEAIVKMFQALSDRDSTALKYYCTPDVTFFEYGQVWNLDTLIRKAITTNQSAGFQRSNSFEFLQTESGKTSAWVTYRLHSTITKDGSKTEIHWLETVALTRQRKRWKVKHLHSTLIKRG